MYLNFFECLSMRRYLEAALSCAHIQMPPSQCFQQQPPKNLAKTTRWISINTSKIWRWYWLLSAEFESQPRQIPDLLSEPIRCWFCLHVIERLPAISLLTLLFKHDLYAFNTFEAAMLGGWLNVGDW